MFENGTFSCLFSRQNRKHQEQEENEEEKEEFKVLLSLIL
jgi:hypothetical protein